MFAGTPGVWHQAFVWLVAPTIWLCWLSSFTVATVRLYLRTLVGMTCVVSGVIIFYVASQTLHLPVELPRSLILAQGAGFDVARSSLAIRFFGLSTLAAAGPFCAAAAVLPKDSWLPGRPAILIAAALAAIAAILSGRRSIALVIVLAPVLTLIIRHLASRRGHPVRIPVWVAVLAPLIVAAAVLAMRSYGGTMVKRATADALYTFLALGRPSPGDEIDAAIRTTQAGQLIHGWADHPVFGAGLGAVLRSGYRRSDIRPWMFELQYHQTLFAIGLIGCALLLVTTILLIWTFGVAARVQAHQSSLVASVTASAALLLANASNPYLQAIGHGWGIALALGVMNVVLGLPPDQAEILAGRPKTIGGFQP
jgi:hypothetical protein